MGILLENLPNSYTITHMNTPHSFGEEIDDSEIDASQEQLELPTTTDDDDFDENTLSMVMGILGLCNIVNIYEESWLRSC